MASHTVTTQMYYDGSWHSIPVYTRDGIAAGRGAGGEGQDAPPSSLTMTVDNRVATREYTPGNPASTLYGKIGRNTPTRLVVDGSTRTTVEASSLKPDQAMGSDPDAWVMLEGGGILRRLQQGKTPLKSALERAILASNPVAYWPLSDGKEATALLSGLTGVLDGRELVLYGARPGVVEGPAGSGSSFVDVAGGADFVSARGPAPTLPAAGWGVEFMVYIGERNDPAEQVSQGALVWYVGGNRWEVQVGYNPFASVVPPNILILDDDGDAFVHDADTALNGWNHCRLTYQQVGGNTEIKFYLNGVLVSSYTDVGRTLASPSGEVVVGQTQPPLIPEWYFKEGGVGVAHLAFYALADAVDHGDAAFGYIGELAGERFLRVLGEEGIAAVVVGDETDTQPMGAQPADTLLAVVRECIRTDDGMLFEPADQIALAMRTGRSRYNQASALDLSWADPGIAPPLRPQFDDRPTLNDVTVQRRNGGKARAVQTTGPLNVSDPIDDPEGVGRVDGTVDVNTETDDVLQIHAGWHLSKGTVPDPRYPNIVIDLDDAPGLAADVDALDIGDRFTLGDLPTDWALEPVSLLLIGVRDSLPADAGHRRRQVTLVTTPAAPYEILLVGDGTIDLRGMRVHTTSSTVDGSHVAADTTILIDSAGVPWTTNADNWDPAKNGGGMFLELAGELVRVTGIAGAGSAWTLTVVRAVNGVSKTIPDGTPVRFKYPGRVAL